MKNYKLLATLAFAGIVTLFSCKKTNHTCTCTTTVGGTTTTTIYDIQFQSTTDAKENCARYQAAANSKGLGVTTCKL